MLPQIIILAIHICRYRSRRSSPVNFWEGGDDLGVSSKSVNFTISNYLKFSMWLVRPKLACPIFGGPILKLKWCY